MNWSTNGSLNLSLQQKKKKGYKQRIKNRSEGKNQYFCPGFLNTFDNFLLIPKWSVGFHKKKKCAVSTFWRLRLPTH